MAIIPKGSQSFNKAQIRTIDAYIDIADRDNKADLEHLNLLIKQFMLNVPFENISVQNGEEINLNLKALLEKIISKSRGGYCYELNSVFKHYIEAKGFNCFNASATVITPKGRSKEDSHMTTIVELNQQHFIADVGFGDLPMMAIPISNQDDIHIVTDVNGDYRAIQIHNNLVEVQKLKDGEFVTILEILLQPKELHEFKVNIAYNEYDERSLFVNKLLITMPKLWGRVTMTYDHLTITKDGQKDIIPVNNEDYHRMLKLYFELDEKLRYFEVDS